MITLEEEKSLKTKQTRLVATAYKTIENKPKGDKQCHYYYHQALNQFLRN